MTKEEVGEVVGQTVVVAKLERNERDASQCVYYGQNDVPLVYVDYDRSEGARAHWDLLAKPKEVVAGVGDEARWYGHDLYVWVKGGRLWIVVATRGSGQSDLKTMVVSLAKKAVPRIQP